jgi:hypothetical protein
MPTKTLLMKLSVCLLVLACWMPNGSVHAQVIMNNASTAAEGYARGLGDIISAQGDYNLATSKSAINMEEADKRDIENRQRWTNAYFEMRKANQTYRAAENKQKQTTMEDAVRFAQMGKPKRLAPKEFNYVTGNITWPKMLLEQKQYDEQRATLEKLFSKRAEFGGVSFEEQLEIANTINTMLNRLKDQIRDVPAATYMSAKHFIESLAYESQLPPNG